jgi:hypothetical protein
VKSSRLESTVLTGIAFLIAVVFFSLAQTADHPVAAAGIGLQTLAGLFAAVQLWANNASNTLLRRAANQIDSNRWHVAGLLDGQLRSLLIATVWAVGGFFSLGLPGALDPPAYIGWPLARDRRRCHHRRHRLLPGPIHVRRCLLPRRRAAPRRRSLDRPSGSIGRQRLGLAVRRACLPGRRDAPDLRCVKLTFAHRRLILTPPPRSTDPFVRPTSSCARIGRAGF